MLHTPLRGTTIIHKPKMRATPKRMSESVGVLPSRICNKGHLEPSNPKADRPKSPRRFHWRPDLRLGSALACAMISEDGGKAGRRIWQMSVLSLGGMVFHCESNNTAVAKRKTASKNGQITKGCANRSGIMETVFYPTLVTVLLCFFLATPFWI